jgi:hypothetical protein
MVVSEFSWESHPSKLWALHDHHSSHK